MASNSETILKTFMKVATQDIKDKIASFGFRQTLGLFFQNSLSLTLGPLAYTLPLVDLFNWFAEIGMKTHQEIATNSFYTSYNLHTTNSGLLIAENTRPLTLNNAPFSLPTRLVVFRPWSSFRPSN